MKKMIYGFFAIALLATSCKKDDVAAVAVTKENVSGNYAFTSAVIKISGMPDQDASSNFEDCERDNITNLKLDNTYIVNDAGVSCNPATAEEGTWNVVNPTTFEMDAETFTISKFDGKILQITQTETAGGITGTYVLTMTKQ